MFIAIYVLCVVIFSNSYYVFGQNILATNTLTPIITSIEPLRVGSTEGGTRLIISGVNFVQGSMLASTLAVYVGGETCRIINYYTTMNRIICYTPQCVTVSCLSDDDWQGSTSSTLSVYLQTVETIVGVQTTYYYNGGMTPAVTKMSHCTRATSLSQIVGKLASDQLENFNVKIGSQFANLGEENEFNSESFNSWSRSSKLLYRPPVDMPAGFYNLSLTVLNDPYDSSRGAGLARMFPKQKSFLYNLDYSFDYNFDASLSGIPFSICLQPVITSISPNVGSIVGGTLVTVVGHGFLSTSTDMTVYIGGRICDVIDESDKRYVRNIHGLTETFQCITRPADDLEVLRRDQLVKSRVVTASQSHEEIAFQEYVFRDSSFLFTSPRTHGSPGWWMKLWDMGSYYSNQLTDSRVRLSGGIRQGLSLGFWYDFGSNWPTTAGYSSSGYQAHAFVADFAAVLTAPYTGTFLCSWYM